jgi:hypothetical protein
MEYLDQLNDYQYVKKKEVVSLEYVYTLKIYCRFSLFFQTAINIRTFIHTTTFPYFCFTIYVTTLHPSKPCCKLRDEESHKRTCSELLMKYAKYGTNPTAFVSIYGYK